MSFIRSFTWLSAIITFVLNLYTYTYPSLNPQQCSWAISKAKTSNPLQDIPYIGDLLDQLWYKPELLETEAAPNIRILAFGDPQINGNWPSTSFIKRLDNYGNDHYLGHIYNVMKRRLEPTHVAVLGDLFSSQWIGDSEFFNRTRRYVTRLFEQPDEHRQFVLNYIKTHQRVDWQSFLEETKKLELKDHKYGFSDVYDWSTPSYEKRFANAPLILNISGNHDIGYSGDATWQHMTRYTHLFGKDNYWIEYKRDSPEQWRIVVLNSLLLEGPALQPEFLDYTWEFLYQLFERKFKGPTVLLTHVPFYKPEGMCFDGPHHDYYGKDAKEQYKIGKLRSQNHLSKEISKRVLNLIFDKQGGIILTGHDHEGCETWYNRNDTDNEWIPEKQKTKDVAIKEVTVRAMMGDYGGNAGILTGKFNDNTKKWSFTFSLCPFSVQQIWWASKVSALITILLLSIDFILQK